SAGTKGPEAALTLFRDFAAAFTAEWNRLQAETSAGLSGKRQELERVERQLGKLVDALAEGAQVSTVKARLVELENRKVILTEALAGSAAPAPRLHPRLADVYRDKVAFLIGALDADDGAELRKQVRSLVETIQLISEAGSLRLEVRGALGAILRFASGPGIDKGADRLVSALWVQVKGDAGTGFEPVTFRL
ncbi:recombinase family protein, partial [Paeniroseomonas aquatica]|nr:recombinase family protein [Paeniroseomonas aquatica]